jgi:sporulation protein YlmC with PRC-barrel domain
MLMKSIAAALLTTTMLAAPALAQTGTSSQNTNSSGMSATTAAPATAGSMSGQFLGNDQTTAKMWRASKLKGVNIYGPNDEKVGDVNDVLLDEQGNAKAVVIGVGGFLGMGEKDVAMPFSQVQWVNEMRNTSASNTGTMGTGTSAPASSGMAVNNANRSTETTATTVSRTDAAANRSYPDHGKISMTKDQLKSAPSYRLER